MSETIIIIDDEPEMIKFIKDSLEDDGYKVFYAYNGQKAIELIKKTSDVSLILLDIMMPVMDGFDVCKSIRNSINCPIIFLTAIQNEAEILIGFALGGDDYILKPFSINQLKARINAHLRRERRKQEQTSTNDIVFDNLTINISERKIKYLDIEIKLTAKEFDIIEMLALNSGRVFSKEEIYQNIWNKEIESDLNIVSEYIRRIREKFVINNPKLNYIRTIWGVGYKWEKTHEEN